MREGKFKDGMSKLPPLVLRLLSWSDRIVTSSPNLLEVGAAMNTLTQWSLDNEHRIWCIGHWTSEHYIAYFSRSTSDIEYLMSDVACSVTVIECPMSSSASACTDAIVLVRGCGSSDRYCIHIYCEAIIISTPLSCSEATAKARFGRRPICEADIAAVSA